jgi:CheY-specific phosphatase CheX
MRVEQVNPFIEAISASFATALGCAVERGEVRWSEQSTVGGDILALIDLDGPARGHVAATFPLGTAHGIVGRLAQRRGTASAETVLVAMAELVELFADQARAMFREQGMEPPSLIVRPLVESAPGSPASLPAERWLEIPFLSELGAFDLRISLEGGKP